MTRSYAKRNRARRTDGPCPKCGSKDNRAFYDNGREHCYGCGDHKTGEKSRNKRGRAKLPKRGIPAESRAALKAFENLEPANPGHSYLRSHRHRGEFALRIASDVRQDGNALAVGMYDRKGRLRNLLYIFPDGTKRTLAGVSTKGLFHRIGTGNTKREWIAEGLATGTSQHEATSDDVYVAFGCSNLLAVAEYVKSLGKHVCICGDVGDKSALIAEEAAASVGGDLFIPPFPNGVSGTDANDYAHEFGLKKLTKRIEKDTQPIPPLPDPIEVAAGMSRKEYRESREALAKALDISVRQLNKEVRERRQEVTFEEPEPWPEPVDGTELVENIRKIIARYVSLSNNAVTAVTLWAVMTYLVDDEDLYIAAILACLSPTKRCGKTTLLKVLKRLVYRPHVSSNSTPATIFRMIDEYQPTFLIDEFDSFKDINPELRGILNSGHDRDMAYVDRCVGDDNKPRRFCTFGSKAIAAIGKVPPTLEDRSIVIDMRRKLVENKKKRLRRPRQGDAFHKLRRQIARWVLDNGDGLCKLHIRDIEGLNDRQYDNWKPLLQVAKRIGGRDYQEEIAVVAVELASKEEGEEDSAAGVLLLEDLKALFERDGDKKLATTFILAELEKKDDRPWPEFRRGEAITARQMAALLKGFGIKPTVYTGTKRKSVRGYKRKDFQDAFERYCVTDA